MLSKFLFKNKKTIMLLFFAFYIFEIYFNVYYLFGTSFNVVVFPISLENLPIFILWSTSKTDKHELNDRIGSNHHPFQNKRPLFKV